MSDPQPNSENYSSRLKNYFDSIIEKEFADLIPPPSIVTPFGIRTFDTILGGGIASSLITAFSSAPETGKSTLAFQFISNFLKTHERSVVVYIDIEGASSIKTAKYTEDRLTTFNIDQSRVTYVAMPLDLLGVFELIKKVIAGKKLLDEKTGKIHNLLIVWDSIAATTSSKDLNTTDPNEVIGFKARELTHHIGRLKIELQLGQITFITIDQIRSNIKITSKFQVQGDKGVGEFSTNYKAATSVNAFQHAVRQWVYLSRGPKLTVNDPLGVDGFILNVVLEKNKLAPSKITIPLVFDKKFGAIPALSEYLFISSHTSFEKKVFKTESSLKKLYPPLVQSSGNSKIISIVDTNTGEVIESTDKFLEKHFLKNYFTNSKFKEIFDKAVDISIQERIVKTFFDRNELTQQFE